MSWIESPPSTSEIATSEIESVLGLRPQLLSKYREFYLDLWRGGLVPRRMLELVRLRIAYIHGAEQEFCLRDEQVELSDGDRDRLSLGDFTAFAAEEQAALAIADRMPFNHHQITDEHIQQVDTALGHPGTVALLTALAFFDVTCRLKIAWDLPVTQRSLQASRIV